MNSLEDCFLTLTLEPRENLSVVSLPTQTKRLVNLYANPCLFTRFITERGPKHVWKHLTGTLLHIDEVE